MDNIHSEDTMFFLALNAKKTDINRVLKAISGFIDEKQQLDITDRFNFIAFTKRGPVYLSDFTYDKNQLENSIKELIPIFTDINVAGGIFVAVTFIIDVFKIVGGKTFRLLLIMDKYAPPLKNSFVVKDLLEKVVDFPFFIDIIRLGTDDPKEDLKLLKLARFTGGDIYYAKNIKELSKVMHELSKKKTIKSGGLDLGQSSLFGSDFNDSKSKNSKISEENKPFYENLADSLISGASQGQVCQICRTPNDSEGLYQCPKCNTSYHKGCLAQWAKFSNIGLEHLFRCPSCFNLLKIKENYLELAKSKQYKEEFDFKDEDEWLSEQDAILRGKMDEIEIITSSDTFNFDDLDDLDDFDDFGELGELDELGELSAHSNLGADEEVFDLGDLNDVQILWCKNCGKMLTSEFKYCNNCGTKLSR